jgi:5-aminopentanamidase
MHVAVAQMEPRLGENERNLDVAFGRLEEAVAEGAELLVLPECALPGYSFEASRRRCLSLYGAVVEEMQAVKT